MNRLKTVLSQPLHKRAEVLDSMYAAARKDKFDNEMAQEVLSVIEQVKGDLPSGHDFGPQAAKLRKQIADPGYPLKVVNYKVADVMGEYDDKDCVDTCVCVKREEIEEIAAEVFKEWPSASPQLLPHIIANEIRLRFAAQIQAAVEAEPSTSRKCGVTNWPIANGSLGQAIREAAIAA